MPQITDDSKLINALRAAPSLRTWHKATSVTEGAGTFHSLWKIAGSPGAGANPPLFSAGAGYVPTKATVGAMSFTNAAANGDLTLAKLAAYGATAGMLIAYDRMWACSGFGTVITTAQAIATPGALPAGRDPSDGLDVEPWLEVYTAPGATTATWTVTGTDGLGNTARTWTYTHPANAESVGQMMPLMPGGGAPAAVATMRQATQFQASATSGTAGDIGITLMRRLAAVPILGNGLGDSLDALRTGLPPVYNNACVSLMVLCTTTNTGIMLGEFVIGESPT